MGDRTFFRVYLYACPSEQQQAALAVLDEYDLGMEFSTCEDPDHDHENPQSLTLVEPYTASEWPDLTTAELARKLTDRAPGASWVMWEDNWENKPGQFRGYTPQLGAFWAEYCTSGGEPLLEWSDINNVWGAIPARARPVITALERAAGKPWRDDWHMAIQRRAAETEASEPTSRHESPSVDPDMPEDLTFEEVTSQSWPPGTRFRPVYACRPAGRREIEAGR